jgi:hypothetical protein
VNTCTLIGPLLVLFSFFINLVIIDCATGEFIEVLRLMEGDFVQLCSSGVQLAVVGEAVVDEEPERRPRRTLSECLGATGYRP